MLVAFQTIYQMKNDGCGCAFTDDGLAVFGEWKKNNFWNDSWQLQAIYQVLFVFKESFWQM